MFKNSNRYRSQKYIAQHASFPLHNFFTVFNNVDLPVSQKCKLFDSLVGSILNFGAEIWENHEANNIELVYTHSLRRILGVKKSTNLITLYGELGRFPMAVMRKITMIKYWIKVLNLSEASLVKKAYLMMKSVVGISDKFYPTTTRIGVHLEPESEMEISLNTIRQRIIDTYCQKWYSNINNSSRLNSYCIYIHNFKPE